jgi:hypothetical protein
MFISKLFIYEKRKFKNATYMKNEFILMNRTYVYTN